MSKIVSVESSTILDLKSFFDKIIEQADMRADRATATVVQPYLPLDQMRRLKAKIDQLKKLTPAQLIFAEMKRTTDAFLARFEPLFERDRPKPSWVK